MALGLLPNTAYVSLDLSGSDIDEIPPGITVQFALNLEDCKSLRRLPEGLRAGTLNISGCTALEALPEGLEITFLDMAGCFQIESWPRRAELTTGRLRIADCTGIRELPPWLGPISQLDLAGCAQLEHLPESLQVSSWIDIADTRISSLPESLRDVTLRWRGVRIDERIAFRPDEITAMEVLAETNLELRRVKMERMGFERFLQDAGPIVLDEDADTGGRRRLLRVELEDDEPLVCVSVRCPSTQRHYLIRVPPDMETCRQAVAWTAGFDDPDDYRPIIET